MNKEDCLHYKFDSFNNETQGGIIKARDILDDLKKVNKPFLDKHSEYVEDYSFTVKELTTDLEYFIYNKNLINGSEDSRKHF